MIIIRIFLSVSLSACLSYLSYIEVWRVSTPIGSLMALSTAYLTPPQPQKYEDDLKNEDYLKNEDLLKNEDNPNHDEFDFEPFPGLVVTDYMLFIVLNKYHKCLESP